MLERNLAENGVKFNPNNKELFDVTDRVMHLAAFKLKENEAGNVFDALTIAVEELMIESTGQKTIWEAGESDRVRLVDEFNTWFLLRWAELRKEVGSIERHCNDLMPFLPLCNSITDREFQESTARYFKLRAEFVLFDDYYYDAVSGVMDFALEMNNPAAAHLWKLFVQANWNNEVKA